MKLFQDKLGTFWLAIIAATICNFLTVTTKGRSILINMFANPYMQGLYIATTLVLIYASYRLYVKKDVDQKSKDFFSFRSSKLQNILLVGNVIALVSVATQ